MTTITELPEDFDHHNPARYEQVSDGPDEDCDIVVVADSEDNIIAYYEQGRLHRDGGPAVIVPDGSEEWYEDGWLHRTDGGPAVTTGDGSCYWYQLGQLHRVGGPAVVRSDGTKEWYQRGWRHRTDGPAIEGPYIQARWYLRGRRVRAGSRKFARARDLDRPTPAWLPPPDEHLEADYEDRYPDFEL